MCKQRRGGVLEFCANRGRRPLVGETRPEAEAGPVVRAIASVAIRSRAGSMTQAVIAEALARDPDLTIGRIASWLDMYQSDFERAFLGKSKDGRPKRRVNVSTASQLMIALGRAPNDLPGC